MKRKKWLNIMIMIFMFIIVFSQVSMGEEAVDEKQPLVTMMLFETDLREAINEISLQTGINIIPDQTVGGIVTADLKDVPLEKALKMILLGGGYTFRKIDDFYFIGLPDPESVSFGELSEVKIIKLQHITVKEVMDLLPPFLEPYVTGNEENNRLTIQAPVRELKRIEKFINQLDRPQKMVEVKVVVTEVDSSEAKNLGTNLLDYNRDEEGSDLISYNTASNILTLGTDYYGQLLTELKVLQEKQKAKIEADPRVLVADGQEASLFIGEEQILLVTSEEESDSYTTRSEELEVGVGLKVRAKIIGEDNILLNLAPEISRYVKQTRPDIIVKKNAVATTVRIKSGQTVVLAGMTMKNESAYNNRVPILGSIPLIRWLFSEDNEMKANRKLLIFVTPVIK